MNLIDMATFANFLTLRNSNLANFNAVNMTGSTVNGISTVTGSTIVYSTLVGKALTTSTLTLSSTIITLGTSTNQSYNFSGGSFSGWVSTLSSLTNTTKVSMNQNATTILVTHSNSSTINATTNTGSTWLSLTGANGLPAGATAYPLTTAAGTPNYTSISQSATGQYILASVSGGLIYTSANYGTSFSAAGMGTPTVYLPMEGAFTDVMGGTVTAPGTAPTYVAGQVGTYSAYFNNPSPVGGSSTYYLREAISINAQSNFTISGWFNVKALPTTGQTVVCSLGTSGLDYFMVTIQINGTLGVQTYYGASYPFISTSVTVSINTWYSFTVIYQAPGTCTFYVNNVIVGSSASLNNNSVTMNLLSIGSYTAAASGSFSGYIDDLRIYTSAVTFTPMIPMNWTHTAMSATGQYMIAASNMGLFLSVNYGVSWAQVAATGSYTGIWTGLAISSSGQYIVALSQLGGYAPYYSTNYGATWNASTFNGYAGSFITISGNGQYSLTGFSTTALLISNYLAGYSNTAYTTPTFTPSIASAIVTASISSTGQYMVLITQGTTNNVYYSTNYGSTFTGITVGSSAMTSCTISFDGTYITVSNATTVYTLNWNTAGYSVSIGNAAGAVNQGQNAIAIGNQAGSVNQSAGSIVLNGTGSALNAYMPGFFVAPIANASSSSQPTVNLLGYGADSQIVNTGASVMSLPNATLDVNGAIAAKGQLYMWDASPAANGVVRITTASGANYIQSGLTTTSDSKADLVFGSIFAASEWMRIKSTGFVGIGITNPGYNLDISGGSNLYNLGVRSNATETVLDLINSTAAGNTWRLGSSGTGAGVGTGKFYIYDVTTSTFGMVILNSGYVGIGTTAPITNLHVRVATISTPVLIVDAGGQGVDSTSVPRGIGKPLIGVGANSWSNISSGDYYGIGFGYNANNTASYYYAAEIGLLIQNSGGGEYGDMVFSTRPTTTITTIASERMRITSAGYVGIGTAAPAALLHLYNTTADRQSSLYVQTYRAGLWLNSSGSGGGSFNIWTSLTGESPGGGALCFFDATVNAFRMVITSTGTVLIGTTTTPGFAPQLVVNNAQSQETVHIYSGVPGYNMIRMSTTTTVASGTSIYFFGFYNNGGGIGSIVGNGNGTVAYNTSSDARLKKNILYNFNGMDIINQLKPASFSMKLDESNTMYHGFIAQDVEPLYPQYVTESSDGMYHMDYSKFVGILVKAVQELATSSTVRFQELAKQTTTQQQTITEQAAKINTLELQMASLLAWAHTQGFQP